ncbi:MAG TPA: AI-2E family transporter [Candidatus Limnocylindria bacterium]|nr:AI-2E family transporter [Candidatus Limnocylindria bacterium]
MRTETMGWAVRGAGLALGVGFVLVVASLFSAARDVVLLVFIAVLLGAALEPVVAFLRARVGVRRGLAILLVYATFLALVIAIAVFVVPAAAVQMGAAVGRLPEFLDRVRGWSDGLQPEALSQGIGSLLDAAEEPFKPGPPPSRDEVVSASLVLGQVAAALVTLLALVFFWLTERSRLQRYVLAFTPAERRGGIRDAWNEIEVRLGSWVRGQLVLMATIGVATAIAYSVLGLPGALLLGLIAAITEVIPIIGPLLGAIPALIIAASISPETAIFTLGIYLLLQAIEGNVLVPIIMRNSVGLSPFLVLVSLLIGGTVGGILGAIVAVPIVAGITVILERLQDRETPVPIDPASLPDEAAREEMEATAPDSPAKPRARRTAEKKAAAEASAAREQAEQAPAKA